MYMQAFRWVYLRQHINAFQNKCPLVHLRALSSKNMKCVDSKSEHIQTLIQFRNGLYVKWVPCHHIMASHQVADGAEDLQIRRVAENILNKQL
jgi:hypothetical protein